MTPDEIALLHMLHDMRPEGSEMILCQFNGDPDKLADDRKWRPRIVGKDKIREQFNVYVCISAMGPSEDGTYRRRKDQYRGGLALMIDDLGTGIGSKLNLDILKMLRPTALIETSPDNYQAIYVFEQPLLDPDQHDALISSFIDKYCPNGIDSGMAATNRVFRISGVNGKAKYADAQGNPWKVRLAHFDPAARYAPIQIAEAFSISLEPRRRRTWEAAPRDEGEKAERIALFGLAYRFLSEARMLKKGGRPDLSGWIAIHCPWAGNHTGGADNGAAIRVPDYDNGFHGAFRCHHGHCEGKRWRDLMRVLEPAFDRMTEELNAAGDDAANWELTCEGSASDAE